jgi:hypothetical protein
MLTFSRKGSFMKQPLYISNDLYEAVARDHALALNPFAGEYEINAARIEISERHDIWPASILPDVILNTR